MSTDDAQQQQQQQQNEPHKEEATTKETATPTEANAEDEDSSGGPNETDLVLRDGFPALCVPGTNFRKPQVDGVEPIPIRSFWASEDTIIFSSSSSSSSSNSVLEHLRDDCETVFTARDKPDGQAYSAGQTFFLPATMTPRCALEGLVQTIFQQHVAHLEEGTFRPEQSGAEWWTLVLDADDEHHDNKHYNNKNDDDDDDEDVEDDEVGLHFDADYELEEQASNILLHPRLATVTYISDCGAPTLIIDKKSPPVNDWNKKTLEQGIGKAWLSHPKLGKHTAFDGRLLHGAPALYFPPRFRRRKVETEPAAKRQKIETTKRYTLLVNIWLNHWVLDAALLDEEVCQKLKTPWESQGSSNLKGDDSYIPPFVWNKKVDLTKPPDVTTVKLSASNVDPAGEDEIALCNHTVTVKYNPTMEECHKASASGSTVEIELEEGALTLHVGEELPTDDEEEVGG